jgi:hypothetical protein
MPRWRTSTVALLTLGAAAGLSGCAREPEFARNGYTSREACLQDYPPEQCSSRSSGGYYFGPSYALHGRDRVAGDPGPGRSAAATGTSAFADPAATSRGGFGSTGRSYASSGRG